MEKVAHSIFVSINIIISIFIPIIIGSLTYAFSDHSETATVLATLAGIMIGLIFLEQTFEGNE